MLHQADGYSLESSANSLIAAASKRPTQASDFEAEFKKDSVHIGSAPDSESEIDEGSEPETLVDRYISLQSQILQLQPFFSVHKLQNSKFRHNEKKVQPIPKVAKLLTKVKKIQSDVLFDEDEASRRWASIRDQYARESAERRKYDLDQRINVDSAAAVKSSLREASVTERKDDEDHLEMVGDLFSNLPEITPDPDTGAANLVSGGLVGQTVTIRNFGKCSGINPRRILEEACKARSDFLRFLRFQLAYTIDRDAACRVFYNVISESTFSFQHALNIDWSVSQDLPQLIHDASIVSDVAEFNVHLQMKTVSTPDVLQSESYISTVALYLIFGHSPKEEKAYLRLPPQWRDLWKEMSHFEKKQNDAADRGVLRQLQNMIAATKSEAGFTRLPAVRSTEPKLLKEESRTEDEAEVKVPAGAKVTDKIAKLWSSKSSTSSYREMQKSRQKLPIWSFRDRLLKVIEDNQVVIVCGETGCGKSTQVCASSDHVTKDFQWQLIRPRYQPSYLKTNYPRMFIVKSTAPSPAESLLFPSPVA